MSQQRGALLAARLLQRTSTACRCSVGESASSVHLVAGPFMALPSSLLQMLDSQNMQVIRCFCITSSIGSRKLAGSIYRVFDCSNLVSLVGDEFILVSYCSVGNKFLKIEV